MGSMGSGAELAAFYAAPGGSVSLRLRGLLHLWVTRDDTMFWAGFDFGLPSTSHEISKAS